jgi:glycosyltransferase involved in cell wall biosynthesis
MEPYTLGLFANMYPAFEGDYRGIFIQQMVRDLEASGVTVKKAVKRSPSVTGYFPFFWQSLSLVRNHELDVLQAEYIPHSSVIPVLLKKKGTPLILKFHGDDARIFPFKNRFYMYLTRYMISRADHIITASEEIRQTVITIGAAPEKTTAIHSGVDTVFFSPRPKKTARSRLELPQEQLIFLFIGRLHRWKGINEVLQVAEKSPELSFVFIGPGAIPQHPANCAFLGSKPPEDVSIWLNAADCLLLPTYTEAVPTSVMEAFASGIPAITTDIGGCPEIVENGRNGLLIPARDADSLFEAVHWMSSHPEERSRMGMCARDTAVNRYDHHILTRQLIEVHEALIR